MNTDGTIKTEEDPEQESKSQQYKILTTMFTTDHREWKYNVKHWKANESRMFAILPQHFPKDLTKRLKSNDMYRAVNNSNDVIELIKMIRDVAHKHDDTTQGTMVPVTSDLALYTMFMTSEGDTEEFYGKFNPMADTINDHDGSAGYHPHLYADHRTILCVDKELDSTTISKDELEKVQKDAKKSACEEYLSCLFILVADSGSF